MNIIDLYDNYENLYYVGGVVRDILLKMPSKDVDITVVGNAVEFCKKLNFGEIVRVNEEFGTVRMLINNHFYDFASTRKEIYDKKGHLPTVVEIGCSLEEDVKRRDFTINSIAKNTKTGEIIDYTGGIEDLKNKKLRVLHDMSFVDDPTRIIRGLKFAIRFGFELEEHTKKLQEKYLSDINYNMSYKRVKDELISTFNLNSNSAYKIFMEQNIYKLLSPKNIEPVNYDISGLISKYFREINSIWLIYAALIDVSNLELTKTELKIVEDYKKLLNLEFKDDFEMAQVFAKCEIESLILYEITKQNGLALKYLDCLKNIKPSINGEDLKMLGIPPSAKYSEIFDYVLKEKFKNPNMKKEDEINLVVTTYVTQL